MNNLVPKLDVDRQQLDLVAIETRLAAISVSPFDFEAWLVFHGHAPADLRALLDEVKRLKLQLINRKG